MEPRKNDPTLEDKVNMEELDYAVELGHVRGDLFDDSEFTESFTPEYMEELKKNPVDNKVTRRMFYNTEVKSQEQCPQCGSQLFPMPSRYLVGAQDDTDNYKLHILGPMGGAYCFDCPTVVITTDIFYDYADESTGIKTEAITVLGVVDRDAIPQEKRGEEFNDDNPLPLVKFQHDPPPTTTTKTPKAKGITGIPGFPDTKEEKTGKRGKSPTKAYPKPHTKRPKPPKKKKKKKKK
jgi:hypothetical protein